MEKLIYSDVWADFPTVTAQQKGYNKRSGLIYTKSSVKNARAWFYAKVIAGTQGREKGGFSCELDNVAFKVKLVYLYGIDKKRKKLWGEYKTTRPDVDNQTKLILDAITDTGRLWRDDSQVSVLEQSKFYWERSAIQIEVYLISKEGETDYEE